MTWSAATQSFVALAAASSHLSPFPTARRVSFRGIEMSLMKGMARRRVRIKLGLVPERPGKVGYRTVVNCVIRPTFASYEKDTICSAQF